MTDALPAHRILVVDDDEAIRVLLCRVLSARGYGVGSARDGQEAMRALKAGRVDLMLLDLMMPVMDGWEVLRRLRELRRRPPVVVVSAYVDRDRALGEGAAECVRKPFGLGQLIETCERILRHG